MWVSVTWGGLSLAFRVQGFGLFVGPVFLTCLGISQQDRAPIVGDGGRLGRRTLIVDIPVKASSF